MQTLTFDDVITQLKECNYNVKDTTDANPNGAAWFYKAFLGEDVNPTDVKSYLISKDKNGGWVFLYHNQVMCDLYVGGCKYGKHYATGDDFTYTLVDIAEFAKLASNLK